MLTVPHAGAGLFAVDRGEGPPLVLVHGGLADHRAVAPYLHTLSGLRVITPDLRGAGRSHWSGDLSWDLLADDLAAILDHLGLQRAAVGGMSMGSGVALRFALRHPERLTALVLIAPVYAGDALDEAQRTAFARMDAAGRRAPTEGIEVLFPLFEALPPPIRERAMPMVASFDPASVAATTRFLASEVQPLSSLEELTAIEVPTLIVPGADPEHPPELAERYLRHLPKGRIVAPEVLGDQLR